MDEPAEHIDALDRARARRYLVGRRGDLEVDPTVRAGAVVVIDVGREHPLEMTTVPDQDPVKALGPHGAHPSLRVCVSSRSPDGSLHNLYAVGPERGVEAAHVLGIPITHEERDPGGALTEGHGEVAGLLGHP